MIVKFITGYQDDVVNLSQKDRVPRFWANGTGSSGSVEEIADSVMLLVSVCFGAIHCIAWGFSISNSYGVVDVANLKCCHNCYAHLYLFGDAFS